MISSVIVKVLSITVVSWEVMNPHLFSLKKNKLASSKMRKLKS